MLLFLRFLAALLLVVLIVGCIGILVPLKFLRLSRRGAAILTISALVAAFGVVVPALPIVRKMHPEQKHQTAVPVTSSIPVPIEVTAPTSHVLNTLSDFEHSEFCQRYGCRVDRQWAVRNGDTNHSYLTNLEGVSVDAQDNSSRQPPLTGFGIMFFNREEEHLLPQDFEVIDTLVRCTNQSRGHAKTMAYIRKNIEVDINCRTCSMYDSSNFVTDGDFRVWAIKVDQQQVGWKRVTKQ